MEAIDIVITWVDGDDPNWQKERYKYITPEQRSNSHVGGDNRYKDQGLLRYWFRGIEQYAPWVNKIHFVTWGHIPSWLNVNHPKLHIVKHEDFIPKEYLPTFNSNAILLNLHRIPGLAERFIFFNDDMYLLKPCKQSMFFKHGLPCDMAVMNPVVATTQDPFWNMMLNNVRVVNSNFNKKKVIRKHPFRWINIKYPFKNNIRNIGLLGYNYFPGFYDCHLPNGYLKSSFVEVWDKSSDICNSTCLHKFRHNEDITEWTMRYWQLASNKFVPINKNKCGDYLSLKNKNTVKYLYHYKKPMVCINDESDSDDINKYFDNKLSNKSSFEK